LLGELNGMGGLSRVVQLVDIEAFFKFNFGIGDSSGRQQRLEGFYRLLKDLSFQKTKFVWDFEQLKSQQQLLHFLPESKAQVAAAFEALLPTLKASAGEGDLFKKSALVVGVAQVGAIDKFLKENFK
jgi:hypothetical protein